MAKNATTTISAEDKNKAREAAKAEQAKSTENSPQKVAGLKRRVKNMTEGERVTVTLLGEGEENVREGKLQLHTDDSKIKVGGRVVSLSTVEKIEQQAKDDGEQQASQAAQAKPELSAPIGQLVREYAEAQGSTATDAPVKGHPFTQKGRIYLQLEGRGEDGGLLKWYRNREGDEEIGKGLLRQPLVDAGFERKPFTFQLNGKQTGASYYSAPVSVLDREPELGDREAPAGGRGRRSAATREDLAEIIGSNPVPLRPDASPEDTARLDELEANMVKTRDAWKASALGKADKAEQAQRKVTFEEAKSEWTAFRKALEQKNGNR